jgi:hypothetical protein
VKRKTSRKRMRSKLLAIKHQLRQRMHDPTEQTGEWLQSVVQGYFNYHAVPGNTDSLGIFRQRVTRLWRWALRRRGQKHRPKGPEFRDWRHGGFLSRACSILTLSFALLPTIQDKSRMRS